MTSNDGKREIKIYKKTYRLPSLSGGKLDQLQKQIRQHNENLTRGKLVVKKDSVPVPKEEKKGIFGKKVIKYETKIVESKEYEPLSFEESYAELDKMIRNYGLMVNFLKYSENDYQRFFQDLAQEVCEVITKQSNGILKDEHEIQEFKLRLGDSLTPERSTRLQAAEQDLFQTARNYGYGAVLILKKLDLMSETLRMITSEQDKDKERLAKILEEMRIDRDIYALQARARQKLEESEKFTNLALNLEKSLQPVMGDIQGLLAQIAQADQKLVKSVIEIQNIADLIENKQFVNIEKDRDSDNLIDFLMTSEIKKGHIQEALDRMEGVNSEAAFDAELMGAGQDVTIADCLGNIREFLDLRLDKFQTIVVSAIAIIEPDLNPDNDDSIILDLGNGITLKLVRVPAGKFMMGSPDDQADSYKPHKFPQQHQVELQEFLIGKYAVTNAQWQAVMKTKGNKKFQGDVSLPCEGVSWHDARTFCKELSTQTGRAARLPTEAEWEYAARGGNQSKGFIYAGSNNLDEVAWYKSNSDSVRHPVGQKKANELGIYDMSGNVWEWCLDEWHDSYANKPENLKKQGNQAWSELNLDDHDSGCRMVIRGSDYRSEAMECRPAFRIYKETHRKWIGVGFRVVVS